MTTLLMLNDAATVLASSTPASGAGSTTFTLVSGSGFPTPTSGYAFYATLIQANNPTVKERVLCTARSGNTVTAIRAQDGTTALPWNANDQFQMRVNAGTIDQMVQVDQLQNTLYNGAAASGTNSLTATVAGDLTALPDRFPLVLTAAGVNTGNVSLDLTIGSTATGVINVYKGNSLQLAPGDISAAGYPILLNYSATLGAWIMQNPATLNGTLSAADGAQTVGSGTAATGTVGSYGHYTLPNGVIVNWATMQLADGGGAPPGNVDAATWTFDKAFSSAFFGATGTNLNVLANQLSSAQSDALFTNYTTGLSSISVGCHNTGTVGTQCWFYMEAKGV